MICTKCKKSSSQGEIFVVDDILDPKEYCLCSNCIQPERSKREDYKMTTMSSYECPKIEMKIDKDILTKYKWENIDAVL